MIYLKLFWSFFQVGLFSFGGGYVAMPLIQNQVVDIHGWLNFNEFSDVITISQMTPGPIAINSATFVGIRIAGIPGAITATIGCVLPSCVIVLFLAFIYYRYRGLDTTQGILNALRPAVIAMIASSGLSLIILAFWRGKAITGNINELDIITVIIFAVAMIALRKWKINPVFVMAISGILGLCIYPFVL